MKYRILPAAALLAICSIGAWLAINQLSEVEPQYVPRSDYNAVEGAEGAFEYYKSIRSNVYTGKVEREDILAMRNALRKKDKLHQAKNDDISWSFMGPDNVGGRTRAILAFPNDVNTLIVGGISGGLFKTTNAGQNWVSLPDFNENLIVSSIAMLGNGAIYVGTGNSRENIPNGAEGSSFVGGGLFMSSDQGQTWSLVNDFQPTPFSPTADWNNIDILKSDPVVDDRLWIGNDFGLFPYIHGAAELGASPEGLPGGNCGDLDISSDGENMIAVIGVRVYVSNDFGQVFENVSTSNNNVLDKIRQGGAGSEICISQNDKNFMFASIPTSSGTLSGIWGSTNGGTVWSRMAIGGQTGPSAFEPFSNGLTAQGWYDNLIITTPSEPGGDKEIIMGGITMFRYFLPAGVTPGIFAWEQINANFASTPGGPPNPLYVHSDIHSHAWDSDNNLWIGCDGGLFISPDNGGIWGERNFNYTTTQYYAIAFNPSGQVLGGLQDNGTLFITLDGASPGQASQFTGGDGFHCEISQEFPDYMFSTIYYGAVFRSTDGGQNTAAIGNLSEISQGGGTDFNTDIALHENMNNQNSPLTKRYIPSMDDPYLLVLDSAITDSDGNTIIGYVPENTLITVESNDSDALISASFPDKINFYSSYTRIVDGESEVVENVGDTVFIKETAQFMLATALSNGVYLTRQPYKTNGTVEWVKIANAEGSIASSMEFSPDGNSLYVGFNNNRLVRYSNLNSAWTTAQLSVSGDDYQVNRTLIHIGQGVITDIEVDYSLGQGTNGSDDTVSERVAITEGNYGGTGKVRVSENAESVAGSGSFENVWNVDDDLTGMPCYSVVMDIVDPSKLMVGTEHGIWYSDNSGASWTNANNGDMVRVPVYDLRQQKLPAWRVTNSGVVYAGTHGRGVFKTDYLYIDSATKVDDEEELPSLGGLKIFPNPLSTNGTVQFDLGSTNDVSIFIYSLDGKLVQSGQRQRFDSGRDHQIRFETNQLEIGTYILQLMVGDKITTGKFVKTL